MLKIGIVGCGAIGSHLAKVIQEDFKKVARLRGICDIDLERARRLQCKLKRKVKILSLDNLIDENDFIIEAASAKASADIVDKAISRGKSIMVMSIGGLLDRGDIFHKARRKKVSIYLPSGAICGLDGLKACGISKIKKITLTTRKPPKSLPAPFKNIKKEKVIFYGDAAEAVKKFPQNINVAAALSLAGLGAKKTMVKIIASPEYKKNIHEIEIESDAAKIFTRTENIPSPANPKTSYLAVLSAVATLRQIFDSIKIGT